MLECTGCMADVEGIANHRVNDVEICTVGALIQTQRGPIIGIFHEYAYIGKGQTTHSCVQMEEFECDVNDKSVKISGGL